MGERLTAVRVAGCSAGARSHRADRDSAGEANDDVPGRVPRSDGFQSRRPGEPHFAGHNSTCLNGLLGRGSARPPEARLADRLGAEDYSPTRANWLDDQAQPRSRGSY